MTHIREKLGLKNGIRIGTTSSSPFTGSPTFDEIPFHVEVGCDPGLGTYVIVERDEDNIVHYGRIGGGVEDNPRAAPERLQHNQAFQVGNRESRPGDRAPHVTRVMNIEVLGEIHVRDGVLNLEEPERLAQTGRGVYELPASMIPWLLGTPDSGDDGLHIGNIKSAKSTVDFFLPMEAIARHILIAGKSGVGKSYLDGVIIEELVRHGIPVICFDVLGDTIKATDDLKGVNYTAQQDFKIPFSVAGAAEFLNFVPNLTKDQSELVVMAYERIFAQALYTLDDGGAVAVTLQQLLNEIQEIANNYGQKAVGERAVTRVQAAINRNALLSDSMGEWVGKIGKTPVTNVFVGHLGQGRRNLVVGATARMLQTLRRRNRIPPFVMVVDEAHLFLPSGGETTPSTSVLREMIRTARHDAIGIILITQSPGSVDKQVMLTCNTRIVFALDRDDLRAISGTMGDLPEEEINRIPKMAKGHAIVSSGMDIMRHPARVRIRKRTTREGAPTPNLAQEVKKWLQKKSN